MATYETLASELEALYRTKGTARYGLEDISQLQHALQTAALAEAAREKPHFILAALLHDVGHFLSKQGENAADEGIDNAHEKIGAGWLRSRFGTEISEPVRLHVSAKRWLCATDPAYAASLAPDSIKSLALQGGAMREDETAAFLREPHAQAAIRLRRYDDLAKNPDARTHDFAHFLTFLGKISAVQ
jgi:phosphonate degradation associated HDIG domain protein